MTETLGAMLTVAGAFALTALIMATGIGMAWLADLVNCEITRRSHRCIEMQRKGERNATDK